MRLINILLIASLSIFFSACTPKCQIICEVGIVPTAVGYTFSELDTVIINGYKQDNTFTTLLVSDTMPNYGYANLPQWLYPGSYTGRDTLGDTLSFHDSYAYFLSGDQSSTMPYDVEIIVRSNNNKAYRFSNIILSGNQSESVYCKEGSPNPSSCSRYITSYELNGNKVNFSDLNGALYFQK